MKTLFFKRIGAYLLDFIIVTFIVSIITLGFKTDNKIKNRVNELLTSVTSEKITIEEYSDELFELNYDYQKSILPNTIVSIVVSIGYFIVFATLNKGQTLGKKMFKIKVVNKDGKGLHDLIGRTYVKEKVK